MAIQPVPAILVSYGGDEILHVAVAGREPSHWAVSHHCPANSPSWSSSLVSTAFPSNGYGQTSPARGYHPASAGHRIALEDVPELVKVDRQRAQDRCRAGTQPRRELISQLGVALPHRSRSSTTHCLANG